MITTEDTLEGADILIMNNPSAQVLDIITHSSMYVVAQERRASQGTGETAGLQDVPEPTKNP